MTVIDKSFIHAYQPEEMADIADYCVQVGTDMGVSVPMPPVAFPSVVHASTGETMLRRDGPMQLDRAPNSAVDGVARENAHAAGTLPTAQVQERGEGEQQAVMESGYLELGCMQPSGLNVGGLVDSHSERRPLSAFMSSEPKSEEAFRPALEVDHFHWPVICDQLGRLCQETGYLTPIVEQLHLEIQQGRSLIGVLGAEPQAGCTTMLLSLARLLAEGGKSVILVDGDDHSAEYRDSSSLADQLGLAVSCGWMEVLSGQMPLAEVAVQSLADAMTIVPLAHQSAVSNASGSSSQQLQEHGIGASIAAGVLRYHFDVVLIDLGCAAHQGQAAIAEELIRQCRIDTTLVVSHQDEQAPSRAQAVQLASGDESVCLGVIENFRLE